MEELPSDERIRKLKAEIQSVFDKHGYEQYFFGFFDKITRYDFLYYEGGLNYIKGCAYDILEGSKELTKKDWTKNESPLPPDEGEEWKRSE